MGASSSVDGSHGPATPPPGARSDARGNRTGRHQMWEGKRRTSGGLSSGDGLLGEKPSQFKYLLNGLDFSPDWRADDPMVMSDAGFSSPISGSTGETGCLDKFGPDAALEETASSKVRRNA